MTTALIPTKFFAITPSDTVPVNTFLGVYVGGAGNVVVAGVDGVQATFIAQAGQYLSGKFHRVMASTTATGLVGLS